MTVKDDCSPEFRWSRGFTERELELKLKRLAQCPSSGPLSDDEAASDPSWHHYYSEALIAREAPGIPNREGKFEQARQAIARYEFSDPTLVRGYFDSTAALNGRSMLLEIKVMGLHVLCGVAVRSVREEQTADRSLWGFRYDTLAGHVESGAEWFLLTKDHRTGDVRFRIQAAWREGTLPSWWSRLGFQLFARSYQRAWHRSAYVRLRTLLQARDLPDLPHLRALVQPWQPPIAAPLNELES